MNMGSRRQAGFTLVEIMIVVAVVMVILVIIIAAMASWAGGKVSTDMVRANRAYDAVASAGYVDMELVSTQERENLVRAQCPAADDTVFYEMNAMHAGEPQRLVVCCGDLLSSKLCSVRER